MSPVELLPRWKAAEEESATHFYAREGEIIFRWIIRILVLVTIVMMPVGYFAWIPATLLVLVYGIRLLINTVESHTGFGRARTIAGDRVAEPVVEQEMTESPADAPVERRATAEPPVETAPEPARQPEAEPGPEPAWKRGEFSEKLVRHEAKIISVLIFVVFIIAAIVGLVHLGWKLLLLSVPVVFAYILLLSWPVLFAAMEEDAERTGYDEAEGTSTASSGG